MELLNPNKKYKSKYNLVYSCQYHVIFSPKYRRPVLNDKISSRLKNLFFIKEHEWEYSIIECEIMPDHVHLLIDVCPRYSVVQIVSRIKGYTSKILREEFPELKSRLPSLWTRSSFISSVGSVSLDVVKQYIENQKGK